MIKDLHALMTDSQEWWPADFGHYGPLFIRMAWHSAGTYRIGDGRGGGGTGQQRFAPLNSWPDNVNLDKARRLLWPIKQKYGRKISWADLMILAGNVALESMGFKTFGFGGGRADVWEPEEEIYWGPEGTWLADERYSGERDLENPLGAVQMGLIYVNPEGPNGKPDPIAAARDIRETFSRMAMNDEETVALIAGGHTLRQNARRGDSRGVRGRRTGRRATSKTRASGGRINLAKAFGADTIGSGLEVTWTTTPTKWSNNFFENLFSFEWELTKSPAGAHQWTPKNGAGNGTVPDAHDPAKRHAPSMLTTDLALRFDPAYEKISRRFYEHPEQFADAFARAWFKLTHRDMGPISALSRPAGSQGDSAVARPDSRGGSCVDRGAGRCGAEGEDPGIRADGFAAGVDGLGIGVDFPRLGQARRSERCAHSPGAAKGLGGQPAGGTGEGAAEARGDSERVQQRADQRQRGKKVSLADLIVLGGDAAIEKAAKDAGQDVKIPFTPGRMDASQEQTDVRLVRAAGAEGRRVPQLLGEGTQRISAEEMLVDRAQLLTLTAPEMTVLVGGLRVLGANAGKTQARRLHQTA